MFLFRKVPCQVEQQDDTYRYSCSEFDIKSKQLFGDDSLEIKVLCPKIKIKQVSNEEISSIIDKLEKYQKSKMSDKEVGKMINKIKEIPSLSEIVTKFQSQQPLELQDLDCLTKAQVQEFYEFDHQDLSLEEDFHVLSINFEKIFPIHDVQDQLAAIYFHQKEVERIEQKQKIAQIMGTAGNEKKKSVVDYLVEKNEYIKKNAAVVYNLDMTSPMPQANDIKRVLDWGKLISTNPSEKIDLAMLENDLDKRDVHYYSRALCYLGLVYVDAKSLCLTYSGEKFFKQDSDSQKLILRDILCQDELFEGLINNKITKAEIIEECNRRGLSGSTVERRISCLESWKTFLLS